MVKTEKSLKRKKSFREHVASHQNKVFFALGFLIVRALMQWITGKPLDQNLEILDLYPDGNI